MEQRRLRLGDILDDYCPRERRVTNHAIVAMIEDDVKQTRCTTCDAEHAYKGAKVPRRRKNGPAALVPASSDVPATAAAESVEDEPTAAPLALEAAAPAPQPEEVEAVMAPVPEPVPDEPAAISAVEDGPVHRPLIRATLPRPEGQKTERPLPDFTVRHAASRGGNVPFRGNGRPKMRTQGGNGNGSGGRTHGRFSGSRPGAPGRGGPEGFRPSAPRHGGKKRSR